MKRLMIGPLAVEPPLLQAPMAGYTNYAYRQMIRRLGGVGLPATEMVSARSFLYSAAKAHRRSNEGATLPDRLWGIGDEPRPLAVQIWDNDPETLATVGRRLVEVFRPSVIDINFGCPARDVAEKAQSGSYLLRYPDRVGAIVAKVVTACRPTPVTAKIRLGATRDTINAIDVAQAVEAAGGAAITIHGRTAADFYHGSADWAEIARVRPYLKQIPLIGNGDLRTPANVVEAMTRYDVDGVMIGRAALGRPWLFSQAAAALRGEPIPPDPIPAEQRDLLLDHFRMVVERFGPTKGTILMRSYACCYGEGRPGARAFRREIAGAASPEEFAAIVARAFPAS
ncbi:MAG: tRNA-dihydrouridine synthase [Thermoguttaceae bacterium]